MFSFFKRLAEFLFFISLTEPKKNSVRVLDPHFLSARFFLTIVTSLANKRECFFCGMKKEWSASDFNLAGRQGPQTVHFEFVATRDVQLSDRRGELVHAGDVAIGQVQARQERETVQMKQASICDEATAEAQISQLAAQLPKLEDAQAVVSDTRALSAQAFQVRKAAGQDVELVIVDPRAVVYRQVLDGWENS
jgi:hypothetical protein